MSSAVSGGGLVLKGQKPVIIKYRIDPKLKMSVAVVNSHDSIQGSKNSVSGIYPPSNPRSLQVKPPKSQSHRSINVKPSNELRPGLCKRKFSGRRSK